MSPLQIEAKEPDNGVIVVRLTGRLNAATSPEAKERLKALVRGGARGIVLDLSELSFIDSSGLAAIVAGYKAAIESGGALKIAAMAPQAAQVFSLIHLDRVFEIYPDVGAALHSFA